MKNILTYIEFLNEAQEWLETGKKESTDLSGKRTVTSDKMSISRTNKYKILEYIFKSGNEGRRYTDIIKFIVEDLKGGKYNWKTDRGYYATNLLGSRFDTGGSILYKYCNKNSENKKWVLTNKALIDHFSLLKAKEKGWDPNDIEVFSELGVLSDMVKEKVNR